MNKRKKKMVFPEVINYAQLYKLSYSDPNGIAYEYGKEQITYSKLFSKVNRVAKGFKDANINPGDQVIVCLPDLPQQVECLYAMDKMGIDSCELHPETKAPAIAVVAEQFNSKAIITTDANYEKASKAISGMDHPVQIILADVDNKRFGHRKARKSKYAKDEHVTLWADFVKRK